MFFVIWFKISKTRLTFALNLLQKQAMFGLILLQICLMFDLKKWQTIILKDI